MKSFTRPRNKRRIKPPKASLTMYRVYDAKGEQFEDYRSLADAYRDVFGPRFYDGYTIVTYMIVAMVAHPYGATRADVVGVSTKRSTKAKAGAKPKKVTKK